MSLLQSTSDPTNPPDAVKIPQFAFLAAGLATGGNYCYALPDDGFYLHVGYKPKNGRTERYQPMAIDASAIKIMKEKLD